MKTTVTYQCPNCGAGLLFDAEKQKFCCEFCLSEFTEAELSETDSADRAKAAEEQAEDFCSQMNEYECPSCGAHVVSDDATAATFCYYCHNPVVLVGRLSGQMKPDKIIPFRYDKKAAEEIFLKTVKRKWFVPKSFTGAAQLEKLSGVYYPFWITDADTSCSAEANATQVRSWRMGNRMYTETSHFRLERKGNIHFEDIVTSALSEADKAMLEGVLPYPSDALQEFSMPYLSGYTAKKRDIEREALSDEVRQKMNGYAEEMLRNTMNGYSAVHMENSSVRVKQSHWEYSLLPVWILTYQGKKRRYTYAMNAYTGKIYGEYPFSLPKVLSFSALLGLLGGLVCAFVGGGMLF